MSDGVQRDVYYEAKQTNTSNAITLFIFFRFFFFCSVVDFLSMNLLYIKRDISITIKIFSKKVLKLC